MAAQAQNAADLTLATTAAAIQRAFIAPPGASRLAGPPAGTWRDVPALPDGGIAGTAPLASSLAGHWVMDNSWWRVPGQPQAVIGWFKAHKLAGLLLNGNGGLAASPADKPENVYRVWTDSFSRFSGPAVLDNQQLVVQEMRNGLGQTVLLASAQVSWIPPKPSIETVPGLARVVTITAVALNGGQHGQPVNSAPVTVTDPARVARIAAAVNGLYRYAGGMCAPLVGANGIRLQFRASPGGPALATVVATDTGCPQVSFVISGQPPLPDLGNNGTLVSTVLSISGLAWYR